MNRKLVRWIVVIAAAGVLVTAWSYAPLEEWMRAFNHWVAGLGPLGWLLFGLAYVVACIALLPGSVLTIGGGLAFGLWAFPLVVVSASLGAWAAFLVGRYLAREAVSRRLADYPRFRAVDQAVGEEGWKIVALMRLSPLVPFNLQNYLFGLTEVRFWSYAWATFFGIMPGTLLYVYLGAAGRVALEQATGEAAGGGSVLRTALLVVGLVATVAVTVIVTRKARERLAAIDAIDEALDEAD